MKGNYHILKERLDKYQGRVKDNYRGYADREFVENWLGKNKDKYIKKII